MASAARLFFDRFITLNAKLANDAGQGLAEYGLILGLIALVCIGAVMLLGGNIQSLLNNVGSSI